MLLLHVTLDFAIGDLVPISKEFGFLVLVLETSPRFLFDELGITSAVVFLDTPCLQFLFVFSLAVTNLVKPVGKVNTVTYLAVKPFRLSILMISGSV